MYVRICRNVFSASLAQVTAVKAELICVSHVTKFKD